MARIVVTGPQEHVADLEVMQRITEQVRSDGHEVQAVGDDARRVVRDADAVVALVDGADAGTGAIMAYAAAANKPVLALGRRKLDPRLESKHCTFVAASSIDAWIQALPEFYDTIKPFAGKLVRDHIPKLVADAGYQVTFRSLDETELPHFLRAKIVAEAEELAHADAAHEKEEIGDLLEALERFIEVRGHEREDLRRVKEAKRKRRGAFEKGFVVEETADKA